MIKRESRTNRMIILFKINSVKRVLKRRVMLKNRPDVVNKSLLRCIRNFFVWGVKKIHLSISSKIPLEITEFKKLIHNYVESLTIPNFSNSDNSWINRDDYIKVLGDIIEVFISQSKYLKIVKLSDWVTEK